MSRLEPEFLRSSVEALFESPPLPSDVERSAATEPFGAVGLELELLPVRATGGVPGADSDQVLDRIAAHTAAAGRFTFEPGGQIEYSGPVCARLSEAVDDMATTIGHVRAAAAEAGLELRARGLAPWFDPDDVGLRRATPRYREMDRYFLRRGPWGKWMMRLSASLQVNLDFGGPGETEARWRTANALGPLLVAVFANSPAVLPDASEVAGGRWWVWRRVDPARTGRSFAVESPAAALDEPSPWHEYLAFALGAPVMFDARMQPVVVDGQQAPRFTDWWLAGGEAGPSEQDWRAHLGTLFPDVRPRRWMEIRAVDVPEPPWWPVPPAFIAALLYDRTAREKADELLARSGEDRSALYERATRNGLADPGLQATARELFGLVETVMDGDRKSWFGGRARSAVAQFRERFVESGRTQSDEARQRGEVARLDLTAASLPPRSS